MPRSWISSRPKPSAVLSAFSILRNRGEIAELMGVSPRTVARDWDFAQSWLYRELKRTASQS